EAAVADSGVGLVRGTEISCTSEGISVHLLSYLHDPHDEELARVFTRSRNFRHTRAHTMVARIKEVYPLTCEEVARRARLGSTIGRPHIADALVARGYVRDRTEAIENILSASGPFYVRYETPEVTRAVDLVVRSEERRVGQGG